MTTEMKEVMTKINKIKVKRDTGKIRNVNMANNHIYILQIKLDRMAKEFYQK